MDNLDEQKNEIRSVEMNGVKKKFINIFKNENKNFNQGDEFWIECQINIHEFSLLSFNGVPDLQCIIYKDDETLEGKWDFEKNVSIMKKIIIDSGLTTKWHYIRCPVNDIYIEFNYKNDDKLLVTTRIDIECEVDEDVWEDYEESDTCIIYDEKID